MPDDESDEEGKTPPATVPPPIVPAVPAMLQYRSPETDASSLARRRALTVWSVALLASWLPFACGVVNALVAAQKYYSPTIVASHFPASLAFMTLGALVSGLSIVGFLRLRHTLGALTAGLVLAAQVTMAICLGLT